MDMRRASTSIAIRLAACSQPQAPASSGSASSPVEAAAVAATAAVPDASIAAPDAAAAAPAPPKACVPRHDPDRACLELALAADGDRAVICYRETCRGDEVGCMLVDPVSGRVLGPASWPTAHTPDHVAPSPFEVRIEDRTIAVCRDGACRRLPDVIPADTKQWARAAVNAQGTRVFVSHGDTVGSTYDVASRRLIARVRYPLPDGPPPPGSSKQVAYHGRSILLGDFEEPGTIERAIDPMTGRQRWLEKPWARLPGDLLVHLVNTGEVDLIDFDAQLAIIARRKLGRRPRERAAVTASLVSVGANALVVTLDPAATLLVDSKTRTISPPRRLPMCP
jgi:hypothetical protein